MDPMFIPGGPGHTISRMCACCGEKSVARGGAIRLIRGVRSWICVKCKNIKDAALKKDTQ